MTREEIISNILLCIELEGDGGTSSFTTEESEEMMAFMNQLRKDNILANEGLVDLGLPSGTLWAKCNLGAEKETDFGLFYQWGNTEGYDGDADYDLTWSTYKWGTDAKLTKYNKNDRKLVLDNEDDPVYVATDGKMMSPTKTQLQELIDYTNHEWKENFEGSGVNGMKFTNKSDETKYIFIPAAGFCGLSYHDTEGSWGYIWSLSRNSTIPNYAWYMSFDSGDVGVNRSYRCYCFSVRGVVNKQ